MKSLINSSQSTFVEFIKNLFLEDYVALTCYPRCQSEEFKISSIVLFEKIKPYGLWISQHL